MRPRETDLQTRATPWPYGRLRSETAARLRILIRTSRWAVWAQGLGSLAVPLVVIPVLLHHLRLIGGEVFIAAITIGGVEAALGLLVSLVALGHLWQSGDRGWDKALAGLALSLLCLLPYGYYGAVAIQYPPVTDIATTDRGLMPLIFEPGTAAMPPPLVLPPAEIARVFPNATTRSYPLGQAQTFALVQQLVAGSGWQVRLVREPLIVGEPAQINAQTVTLPGWREEAVIRVTGTAASSVVDMRSASLNAPHDFGSNGSRIEHFMIALDDAVTTLLRDNPNANQPLEADPDAEAEAEPEAEPDADAGE
jgi:hypothetical protein